MEKDTWQPIGFRLDDDRIVRSLQFRGTAWQIYALEDGGHALLAMPELALKWIDGRFLEDALLATMRLGVRTMWVLCSPKAYVLAPVDTGLSPANKVDAVAFSLALKESRKLSGDASFHDAIYVERYSKLLPTWTLTPAVDDAVVLGTWLSGGVPVSVQSFRRLKNLAGWLAPDQLVEIIEAAGMDMPADADALVKRKPISEKHEEAKTEKTSKSMKPESENKMPREKPQDTFSLPGRPHLETFFNEHVVDIIFNAEKYSALGIDFPAAIVLHGPPGCGKTFAVERLVEFIGWPSFTIDSNSVGSPYIHETSKKISSVFNKALDEAPSVVVIDEMESFLSDRRTAGVSGLHHVEEVAEFLRRIPEAIKNRVLVIAMTNMIEIIDPAILRRGRFDHIIEVAMPSRDEVASLLKALLDELPTDDGLNMGELLDVLAGKPLSDVAFVIREGARIAAKTGKACIDQESLVSALSSLPKEKKKTRQIGFARDV